MIVTITPNELCGRVTPPPSKSQAHRLLIAAALAGGESVIENVAFSKDIEATIRCLTELGAAFERTAPGGPGDPGDPSGPCDSGNIGGPENFSNFGGPGNSGKFGDPAGLGGPGKPGNSGTTGRETIRVTGMGANVMSPLRRMAHPHLDCGESGSTLRFLIPIALAVRGGGIFTGQGRLMERPLTPYFDLFQEKGIFFEQRDGTLTVSGLLTPGVYELPGNVSSQFFTGLLFALPLLDGPSAIIPIPPLESEGYIQMTLQAMARFGVEMPATLSLPPQYHPQGNQEYSAANVRVEADWSQAAFWYAAKFLGSAVEVTGLDRDSTQGDSIIRYYAEQLKKPGEQALDLSGCPDLAPPLAAMAALRAGEVTRLVNAARLRMKESDRLASVTAVLTALGADVEEGRDCLTIRGRDFLPGGVTVDSCNDHRIAMMAAVAATRCIEPVKIRGAECVAKSYPDFWEEYEKLGGKVTQERA